MNVTSVDVRSGPIVWRKADLFAAVGILVAITAALIYLFRGGAIGSIDSLVSLYPAWDLLGERIRAGELPLWNPSAASGAPLAADLQSGWFYLPVIIGFALLPISSAAIFLSGLHLILAGYGTYGLARVLGISPTGSTLASIAYTFSGWFSYRMSCCPADISTAALMPVVLLTTELALRAEPGPRRTIWRLLSALSLAQLASAWIGPGSYYVVIALAGYLIYRTLIDPPWEFTGRERLRHLLGHSSIVGLVTAGLAMGGLLPRSEYYGLSRLGAGYPVGTPDGWSWFRVSERLLGETSWYAGAVTLALAFFGLLILRKRFLAPYWAGLVLFAAFFATRQDGIVREIVYTLMPGFESVQQNLPNRVLTIAYLGLAILAGGVAAEVGRWRPTKREAGLFVILTGGIIAYAIWSDGEAATISARAVWPLVGTVVALALVICAPGRMRPALVRIAPVILLLGVTFDLVTDGYREIEQRIDNGVLSRVDLATYYDVSPAAAWLQGQAGMPFRFAGVDPSLSSETRVGALPYGRWHGDPFTAALVVNNRAALLDLEDIQSTNFPPMRLVVYDDVLVALNGATQDYHSAVILNWEALRSPVIRLLNLRYIVIPRVDADGNPPPESALAGYSEVWSDEEVRILEHQNALPRAWLVHDLQVVEEDAILARIAGGSIDPAVTALVSAPIPGGFEPGAASDSDSVTVVRESPERLQATVHSATSGLLVFSETTHPGLRVEIDGKGANLLTVNHAYVGVVVPAGEHTVTLTYTGRFEKTGLAISFGTLLMIGGYWFWYLAIRNRRAPADSALRGEAQPRQ